MERRRCGNSRFKAYGEPNEQIAPQWVVKGDIKACFDEINHEWILENTPMNKRVLKEFLKSGYVEK